MDSNSSRAQRLREQVEARVRVLQRWSAEGVPDGAAVPASLNKVRLWRDADRGIEPIGSPSSFTTTHPAHGAAIGEIAELLKDLRAKKRTPRQPNDRRLLEQERRRTARLENALTEAANLHMQLSVELDDVRRRLVVTQHRLETVEQDLREARSAGAQTRGKPASAVGRPHPSVAHPDGG